MDKISPSAQDLRIAFANRDNLLSWFYWIGGLSLINSIISILGMKVSFIFWLGFTQIIDYFLVNLKNGMPLYLTIIFTLLVILIPGCFFLLWYLAKKMLLTWPIWLGFILYILDTFTLLLFEDYLSIAFHGYVIFRLIQLISVNNFLRNAKVPVPSEVITTEEVEDDKE